MRRPKNLTNVMVLGDGQIGKTSLLITYMTQSFPGICRPTVFEYDTKNVMVNGKQYTLGFYDLPGHVCK